MHLCPSRPSRVLTSKAARQVHKTKGITTRNYGDKTRQQSRDFFRSLLCFCIPPGFAKSKNQKSAVKSHKRAIETTVLLVSFSRPFLAIHGQVWQGLGFQTLGRYRQSQIRDMAPILCSGMARVSGESRNHRPPGRRFMALTHIHTTHTHIYTGARIPPVDKHTSGVPRVYQSRGWHS